MSGRDSHNSRRYITRCSLRRLRNRQQSWPAMASECTRQHPTEREWGSNPDPCSSQERNYYTIATPC